LSTGKSGKLAVAAIGLGWVTTNRHIPWLLRNEGVELVGVVDPHPERVEAAARGHRISRTAVTGDPDVVNWLDEVDAVTIGTPPRTHAALAHSFLASGKHVLVEKPFAMTPEEADDLARMAKRAGPVLAVVHNFQFSRAITRLKRLIHDGSIGAVRSIWATQLSNPRRRLPSWYEELPLGLFYDESPHIFYVVRSVSPVEPVPVRAAILPSRDGRATPHQINLAMLAGDVPINISIDFEAPVSEWHVAVMGSRCIAVADLFRDVLVVVGNDGRHRGREILRTTWSALRTHVGGVATSGALLVSRRLPYGNDEVIRRFVNACVTGSAPAGITPADGQWVTDTQHWVVAASEAFIEDSARKQLLLP
jgi:scyllo-inositol 2-dehydrogenase (NADP+)